MLGLAPNPSVDDPYPNRCMNTSIVLEPKKRGFRIQGRRETFATRRAAAKWLSEKLWRGRVQVRDDGSRLVATVTNGDPHLEQAVILRQSREFAKAYFFGSYYGLRSHWHLHAVKQPEVGAVSIGTRFRIQTPVT